MNEIHKVYIPFSELLIHDCFEIHPQHLLYEEDAHTIYEKRGEDRYSRLDGPKEYILDDETRHHLMVRYCPMMHDDHEHSSESTE